MSSAIGKLGRRLFRLLSSLKLAVVVLLSLGTILAVGTVYESLYDTATAKHYVYGTTWFAVVLGILGTNVFFAALSRWPWKRHHIGFLITHLGIILLLIGSLITLIQGYEGQMVLAEGETGRRMTIQEPQLYFYDLQNEKLEQVEADFRFDPPSQAKPWSAKALSGLMVTVDDFIPHAVEELRVENDGDAANPALAIRIQGSRAEMEEWVFAREFDRQSVELGPARLIYIELPDAASLQKILATPEKFSGPLLQVEKELVAIPAELPAQLRAGSYTVTVQEYFPHAAVEAGRLKNISDERQNPTLSVQLSGPKGEERHSVFAKFPELPTAHGRLEKPARLRLYDLPTDWNSGNNELLLARLEDGSLLYALKSAGAWSSPKPVEIGAAVATGWMDFQFTVAKQVEKARLEKVYRKVPVPKGKEGPPSAIHLKVADGFENRDFWLGRGSSRDLMLGGRRVKIAYGLKTKPIGFELKLDKFKLGTYEGTKDPSTYESDVTLITGDESPQGHRIAMNEPLEYGRDKFFQASYQINPEGPDFSVLAVAYDPGIFLKYLGSLVMVGGIALMFFFKPLFVQKRIAARKAKAALGGLSEGLSIERAP